MAHDWINEAQQCLGEGKQSLTTALPAIIAKILRDELWKERSTKEGEPFRTFQEFCEYKLWWGLECSFERMLLYCEKDAECRALLWDSQPKLPGNGELGRGRNSSDNIRANFGTSQSYTYRRLRRDAPELAEQVRSGAMTANAAAIAAGFRKRTMTVAIEVDAVERAIRAHFTRAQRRQLAKAINDE